ncbi:hypothetical protein [Methylobacterium sp. NEAU K]|uniref:hypothetical protein n=1 Tax=Methylobacterium sp. NEAU K TaxID=3064946 RepID=UPI0027340012|nr:hypothetical protein [Methylobacterium sp. NEAU K]MDP4002069.1 hypothetical protein [Methylobacterium sp. NEAU K]
MAAAPIQVAAICAYLPGRSACTRRRGELGLLQARDPVSGRIARPIVLRRHRERSGANPGHAKFGDRVRPWGASLLSQGR